MAQKKKSSNRKTASPARKSSKATKAKPSINKGMKVTKRIVDVRRHTTGYVVGGKMQTVAQVRKLAENGRVRGVQVVGNHIQAMPGQPRLTDLPMKIS